MILDAVTIDIIVNTSQPSIFYCIFSCFLTDGEDEKHIFVSYSWADKEIARKIAATLKVRYVTMLIKKTCHQKITLESGDTCPLKI